LHANPHAKEKYLYKPVNDRRHRAKLTVAAGISAIAA